MKRIAVIGAGNWGTALSILGARKGHEVRLWSRNADVVASIRRSHVNSRYLSNAAVPASVTATTDLAEALDSAELVILAAPSHVTRELLIHVLPFAQSEMIFISATKGIEIESGKRMSQVTAEVL